jgi:hypothetical protein
MERINCGNARAPSNSARPHRGRRVVLGLALLAACARDHRGARPSDDEMENGYVDAASDVAAPPEPTVDASIDASVMVAVDATTPDDAAVGPDTGAPSTADAAPPAPACDEVLELRAHASQTLDDPTPYTAPPGDSLELFWFAPKWSSKLHLIGVEPLLDNSVAREWTLSMKENGVEAAGTHQRNSGLANADRYLLAYWSSAAPSMPIPDDVGIKVEQGERPRLSLEIHYNAPSSTANRADRSGVRLCLSRSLRPKEAALHWVGSMSLSNPGTPGSFVASGVCMVPQVSQLVAYAPRMRSQGRRMTIVVQRSGMDIPLIDRPFDLSSKQLVTFPSEVSIQKGDMLRTTCTYAGERPFQFGPTEDDEECFALILAWPAGSLSNGGPGIIGGRNNCLDWN